MLQSSPSSIAFSGSFLPWVSLFLVVTHDFWVMCQIKHIKMSKIKTGRHKNVKHEKLKAFIVMNRPRCHPRSPLIPRLYLKRSIRTGKQSNLAFTISMKLGMYVFIDPRRQSNFSCPHYGYISPSVLVFLEDEVALGTHIYVEKKDV